MGKFVPHHTCANVDWNIWQEDNGRYQPEAVTRAILLDIRSELQKQTAVLQCQNLARIPALLKQIAAQTKRKKRTV